MNRAKDAAYLHFYINTWLIESQVESYEADGRPSPLRQRRISILRAGGISIPQGGELRRQLEDYILMLIRMLGKESLVRARVRDIETP